jgi:uncharacterized protein YecT (DUF1311 family)
MMRFVVLLSICFLTATHLRAQQMNERDSPCAGIGTTSDLVSCLWKAGASSNEEMKVLYQKIQKNLNPAEAEHLLHAQKLWTEYREANCSAERSLYQPGTGAPPAYLACLEAMTRERTKELRVTYAVRLK